MNRLFCLCLLVMNVGLAMEREISYKLTTLRALKDESGIYINVAAYAKISVQNSKRTILLWRSFDSTLAKEEYIECTATKADKSSVKFCSMTGKVLREIPVEYKGNRNRSFSLLARLLDPSVPLTHQQTSTLLANKILLMIEKPKH